MRVFRAQRRLILTMLLSLALVLPLVVGSFETRAVFQTADIFGPPAARADGASVPAFPGAEGFGALTPGGRGGKVYYVDTIDDVVDPDDGLCSLREAVEAQGPRMVLFEVSGTIELQAPLVIKEPYITIAGQTAPGDGIALKNGPKNKKAAVKILTHDVVIRYLRIRPGPSDPSVESQTGAIEFDADVDDSGNVTKAYNVMIDHCSFSWAVDENVSSYGRNRATDSGRNMEIRNITIQWAIISEALHLSNHEDTIEDPEKGHSMGLMLGKGSGNISVHHNLLAHNNGRNPRIKTSGARDGVIDFVNNVIYNFGSGAGGFSDDYGRVQVNYVGNLLKEGPDSTSSCDVKLKAEEHGGDFGIFAHDNIRLRRNGAQVPANICTTDSGDMVFTRHTAPTVTTTSPLDAYDQVLAGAGATLPARDAVDQRIVTDVLNGTGGIINDPSETGGWPVLSSASPPLDLDHDGMPDEWEVFYDLDPLDGSDGPEDDDGDGYTNVEEYLNGTFPILPTQPQVDEVTIPSEGGAYFDQESLFTSSYSIATETGDLRIMRLLISNHLVEEDSQFYGVVVQQQPGVFTAYLHDGRSRWPKTAQVPGAGYLGGYPIGVGEPLHDGSFIENRWVRWNVGESYLTVEPSSNTVAVHWDVLFRPSYYGVQPDQKVFSCAESRFGEVDNTSPTHVRYGWHLHGSWAVWGYGTFVKNPSFEFDPVGEGLPSLWSRSYGTPEGTRFGIVEQLSTTGTRSAMVETVPGPIDNYYQGLMQNAHSPGQGIPMEFSCDLHVARGTVVINLFTWYRRETFWLGYAVVDANRGFERVTIPFETPNRDHFPFIYYRIDGIQPQGTASATLFYLDDVALDMLE